MLYGIDISHHQPDNIIRKAVIAYSGKLQFVIVKATEGVTHVDNKFDKFMEDAKESKLLRGAYHYVNAKNGIVVHNAQAEAANFIRTVRPYGDCLLALDFEDSSVLSQAGADYLGEIAREVRKYTGAPPLIYMSQSVLNRFDFTKAKEVGCGVWVARWKTGRFRPTLDNASINATPGEFGIVAIQQVANGVEFDGGLVSLDADIANMSEEAWAKYANPRLFM